MSSSSEGREVTKKIMEVIKVNKNKNINLRIN